MTDPPDEPALPPGITYAELPSREAYERPKICGTALLSIERIGQLRALGEAMNIGAIVRDDEIEVHIALGALPEGALALPTQLSVLALPEGAPYPGGSDAFVALASSCEVSVRVPRKGLQAGSKMVLWLGYADALYERTLVVGDGYGAPESARRPK